MMLYALLGLMAMAAGAIAIAMFTLPAGFVRDRIIVAVKEQTGRDLVIAGPASFTVFPHVGISLSDVSLSSGPGFEDAAPLVKMSALDVSVALWPLFQREVRVQKLALRDPVFHLAVDADGRRSWEFAAHDGAPARIRLAQADTSAPVSDADPGFGTPASDAAPRGSNFRVGDLALDDVRIDNGSLTYHNALTGGVTQLSAINVSLAAAALTQPLHANGNLAWKERTVRFDGTLTSLGEFLANQPAKLKVALSSDAVEATFEGSATLQDALLTEGILSANSTSARDLFAWFGTDLRPSDGFGRLSAKGLLRGTREQFTFSNAEIVLDRTTAHGELSLDTRGMRPFVKADLKLSELDLNLYRSKGGAAAPTPRPSEPHANSIDDILERTEPAPPGPRVQGYTARAGWSNDPIDLDGLGRLDADATLSVGHLTVDTIRLDQSDLTVLIKNRVMTTTLNEVRLYGGVGRGTVMLDGSGGATARLGVDLKTEGIEALPLLKDAADIDKLTGKGRLGVVLTGDGKSEREIVETLAGRIEFAFEDGAVIGVNVGEMLRNLSRGNLSGLATAPTDKTDFSALTSTWTVTAGVAENQDLRLTSPLLRLTGSGRVLLPQREVDYTLKPRLVASLSGQGGSADLSGLEIPVRVTGSWEDPKFAPDLSGLVRDPDQAVGAIRELGKQFKGKNANEIVDGLLGSDGEARGNARETGKKLLEQFLGPR
ncbi:AsmA family protein [Hyphomicrobium sp.]|uniref:AsmA family protein n=1 Tax=Hyphomicrobium sp. TaxID=82 RepID=UPI002C45E3B0|nr:AsmA family protein [Hyphomicrobium sp.]HRN89373.1 AsmA family protein [Hyphomicrobium sp.]HRQ27334.1 AsmA family protein [Hyphomicrobium sp.]